MRVPVSPTVHLQISHYEAPTSHHHCLQSSFTPTYLQEPFGLTLIEAAAHGVPIVATSQGGPVDIVSTLGNGVLIDPNDVQGTLS